MENKDLEKLAAVAEEKLDEVTGGQLWPGLEKNQTDGGLWPGLEKNQAEGGLWPGLEKSEAGGIWPGLEKDKI